MLVLGVDEAGRGPVIGPMVMCGAIIDSKKVKQLEKLQVKDSKLLTKKTREELFDQIKELVDDYQLVTVLPDEIDDAVNSEIFNLNKLEAKKTAKILNKLKPNRAYIDCPDVNPENYKKVLQKQLKEEMELVVEHKAERYAIVAAASILAKVTRDRLIDKLKKKYDVDFGSGYSSDPYTKKFMAKHWNKKKYSPIIRKSWATYKNLKIAKSQTNLGNF